MYTYFPRLTLPEMSEAQCNDERWRVTCQCEDAERDSEVTSSLNPINSKPLSMFDVDHVGVGLDNVYLGVPCM